MTNNSNDNNNGKNDNSNSKKGFASMDPQKAHEIQKKGGESTSKDREHMAEIGKEGGKSKGSGNK